MKNATGLPIVISFIFRKDLRGAHIDPSTIFDRITFKDLVKSTKILQPPTWFVPPQSGL